MKTFRLRLTGRLCFGESRNEEQVGWHEICGRWRGWMDLSGE